MLRAFAFALAALFPWAALAGDVVTPPPTFTPGKWPPLAVTDPIGGDATHCALIVDGKQWPDVPLQADRACRIDVSTLSAGVRRVQVVAVRVVGAVREQGEPAPPYADACALVAKPSTTSFRVGWSHVVTCTQISGCKTYCP